MLPIFKSEDKDFMLMQSKWSSQLNVLLGNPALQSSILKNVSLIAGTSTVNHLLGQKLQGWKIIRQRGPAAIYDNQDSNPRPELTLILISDTAVSVDLEIF